MGSSVSHPPPGLCSSPESVANRGGLDHDPPATLLSFSFFGFHFDSLELAFTRSPVTAFPGPHRFEDCRPRPALASLPPPSKVPGL